MVNNTNPKGKMIIYKPNGAPMELPWQPGMPESVFIPPEIKAPDAPSWQKWVLPASLITGGALVYKQLRDLKKSVSYEEKRGVSRMNNIGDIIRLGSSFMFEDKITATKVKKKKKRGKEITPERIAVGVAESALMAPALGYMGDKLGWEVGPELAKLDIKYRQGKVGRAAYNAEKARLSAANKTYQQQHKALLNLYNKGKVDPKIIEQKLKDIKTQMRDAVKQGHKLYKRRHSRDVMNPLRTVESDLIREKRSRVGVVDPNEYFGADVRHSKYPKSWLKIENTKLRKAGKSIIRTRDWVKPYHKTLGYPINVKVFNASGDPYAKKPISKLGLKAINRDYYLALRKGGVVRPMTGTTPEVVSSTVKNVYGTLQNLKIQKQDLHNILQKIKSGQVPTISSQYKSSSVIKHAANLARQAAIKGTKLQANPKISRIAGKVGLVGGAALGVLGGVSIAKNYESRDDIHKKMLRAKRLRKIKKQKKAEERRNQLKQEIMKELVSKK